MVKSTSLVNSYPSAHEAVHETLIQSKLEVTGVSMSKKIEGEGNLWTGRLKKDIYQRNDFGSGVGQRCFQPGKGGAVGFFLVSQPLFKPVLEGGRVDPLYRAGSAQDSLNFHSLVHNHQQRP